MYRSGATSPLSTPYFIEYRPLIRSDIDDFFFRTRSANPIPYRRYRQAVLLTQKTRSASHPSSSKIFFISSSLNLGLFFQNSESEYLCSSNDCTLRFASSNFSVMRWKNSIVSLLFSSKPFINAVCNMTFRLFKISAM